MWISRQINDRKSHPTTKYAFMHYSCAPVHTGIYNRDHYHIHWWSLSLDVALVSYLTTVFPFGLNHSAKVSLNTSCFLYVSDRDAWFCFIMMIFFFFKVLLQNETIQGFMKDYRCLSLNTPASPPLCPCSFWDWGGEPGWPFILLLHLFSGASFPFYVLNLLPSAGGTTFHSASVAERQQLWWLHWLLV